jgi:TM2 domain-containing membrane protein YozV
MTQPAYGNSPEPLLPPPHVPPAPQPPYYQQPAPPYGGHPSAPPQGPYQAAPPQGPAYPALPPQPGAYHPGGQHPLAPAQYKDSTAAWLLWFFTGFFGGHHFYLGRTQRGVIYAVSWAVSLVLSAVVIGLLGFVVLFVFWIIDATQLAEQVRQHNARAYLANHSMGFA